MGKNVATRQLGLMPAPKLAGGESEAPAKAADEVLHVGKPAATCDVSHVVAQVAQESEASLKADAVNIGAKIAARMNVEKPREMIGMPAKEGGRSLAATKRRFLVIIVSQPGLACKMLLIPDCQ